MTQQKCPDCGHVHQGGYCAEVCVKCIEEELRLDAEDVARGEALREAAGDEKMYGHVFGDSDE